MSDGSLLPSQNLSTACVTGFIAGGLLQGQNFTQEQGIAFCTQQITAFAASVAQQAATFFGGPGMVVGASWPFIFIGMIIAVLRLWKIVNARSVFLFVATLGNAVFASSVTYGFRGLDVNYAISDITGACGFIILLTFLAMAGITRFGQVITRSRRRKFFQRGGCTFMLLYSGALGYKAATEIIDSPKSPTTFSVLFTLLCFVPLVVYLLGGLFTFSWNLPRYSLNMASDRVNMLTTLRIVNDVMMGAVVALCISHLSVFFPLRPTAYNNSVACLHISVVLFIENIFETVSNAMRGKGVFSVNTSRHTDSELSALRRPNNTIGAQGRYQGPHKTDSSPSGPYTESWAMGSNAGTMGPYGSNGSQNPYGRGGY